MTSWSPSPGLRLMTAVGATALVLGAVAACSDADGPGAASASPTAASAAPTQTDGTAASQAPPEQIASEEASDASEEADDPGAGGSSPAPGDAGYVEPEAPPVDVSQSQSSQGAQVQVSMEAVQAEATLPGEIGGAAVRVTVTLTVEEDLDLSAASVELRGADDAPAPGLTGNDSQELPSSVTAGQTVTGTYVFSTPPAGPAQVRVSTTIGSPILVFTGTVA